MLGIGAFATAPPYRSSQSAASRSWQLTLSPPTTSPGPRWSMVVLSPLICGGCRRVMNLWPRLMAMRRACNQGRRSLQRPSSREGDRACSRELPTNGAHAREVRIAKAARAARYQIQPAPFSTLGRLSRAKPLLARCSGSQPPTPTRRPIRCQSHRSLHWRSDRQMPYRQSSRSQLTKWKDQPALGASLEPRRMARPKFVANVVSPDRRSY